MNKLPSGIEWFNSNIRPHLSSEYEIKLVEEEGDLGFLTGVQFDSNKFGGYVYFWSSGFIGYQLVDYQKELELVEDTTEEVQPDSVDKVLMNLKSKVVELNS